MPRVRLPNYVGDTTLHWQCQHTGTLFQNIDPAFRLHRRVDHGIGREGVWKAHPDMATMQAALKGAARRLELQKQRRASADDAAATEVLTRGLSTHDGTAMQTCGLRRRRRQWLGGSHSRQIH